MNVTEDRGMTDAVDVAQNLPGDVFLRSFLSGLSSPSSSVRPASGRLCHQKDYPRNENIERCGNDRHPCVIFFSAEREEVRNIPGKEKEENDEKEETEEELEFKPAPIALHDGFLNENSNVKETVSEEKMDEIQFKPAPINPHDGILNKKSSCIIS